MAEPASHEVFSKIAPESLDDLRAIEARVEEITAQAAPATVSLELGRQGTGSGVVVGTEGYILTAAHVIGDAGRRIGVTFPDGRVETAITLGSDKRNDAGLAKLEGEGPWPHVDMAEEGGRITYGDWVVALGHPGGFDAERSIVVRLGRVVRVRTQAIQSDCSLIGGDSGGPLFNMEGKVVGIHSRIGSSERTNIHVPIDEYHIYWDRLISDRPPVILGVRIDSDPQGRGVVVTSVGRRTPAAQAGLRTGDIITAIDGQAVLSQRDVTDIFNFKVPGDALRISVLRDEQEIELEVRLGGIL
ncbi:MAG: S1C family serine protease [Planctomycetota bacterium]